MTTEELEVWKRLNECECVKKAIDVWYVGDHYLRQHGGILEMCTAVRSNSMMKDSDLWVPPLHDPICPERSLIGIAMVKYDVELHVNQGWVCHLMDKQSGERLYGGYDTDRPDLALARAIIEQEGK